MPGVSGQTEEHDLPLRPRNLPDVRGQNERVSDMQENSGEENITLLATNQTHWTSMFSLFLIQHYTEMNYLILITPYHTQPT